MDLQHELDMLCRDHQLKPADVHFLDLVPLIEMMWVDGDNQDAELRILYKFTIEHLAALDQVATHPAVSIDDANDFLARFAHRRPDPELLSRLHKIVLQRHRRLPYDEQRRQRWENILDYCLDIAAACITRYPYGMHERILAEEKRFLKQLIRELTLPTGSSAHSGVSRLPLAPER